MAGGQARRRRHPSLIPESVLGVDTRTAVPNTSAFPWRCVCQVEAVFPSGATLRGSGALIGYRAVLTAAHCIYDFRLGGYAKRVLVTAGGGAAESVSNVSPAAQLSVPTAWRAQHRWAADYGLIRLAQPVGRKLGWFGLAAVPADELRGAIVNIAGYPVDLPQRPIEARGRVLYWAAGTVLDVDAHFVRHSVDTYYGQSGSPIWVYSRDRRQRLIVAVHTSGSAAGNVGVRMVKAVLEELRRWRRSGPRALARR